MAQTLYLVRHGECEGAGPGTLLGKTDVVLSANGRRQAAALRPLLPWGEGARVVCSPMRRARETAALAWAGARPAGSEVLEEAEAVVEVESFATIDPDLAEIDFGQWEGRLFPELETQYPELVAAWSEFRPDFVFPGGEGLGDFAERVVRAAGRLTVMEEPQVVAFTHGGVIRTLVCHFLGLPLRNYLLFDIAPASVTILRVWGERGVLSGLFSGDVLADRNGGWVWRRSSS